MLHLFPDVRGPHANVQAARLKACGVDSVADFATPDANPRLQSGIGATEMNVIDLAAVRAARKASVCTFEIFDGLRRREGSDIVMVGALGDFETIGRLFQMFADARRAFGIDVEAYPAEMAREEDGRFWAEAYVPFAAAISLRDYCRTKGISVRAA